MIYRVEHTTTYTYSSPAILSCNDVCLGLRQTSWQKVLSSTWHVDPEPGHLRDHRDFFGNSWKTMALEEGIRRLVLSVRHEVEVSPRDSLFGYRSDEPGDQIHPYLWKSPMVDTGAEFAAWAKPSFPSGRPLLDCVMDLTLRIFREFKYAPATTVIGTTTHELLKHRRGVCQDYAHFALAALRSLGIAARYVSGYLNTVPKPGQEKVYGADASHAWISVYDNEQGWVDFDPTNGVRVADGHITIGWGRDYGDVTPLRGVILGGGTQTLKVMVDVRNLPPRS